MFRLKIQTLFNYLTKVVSNIFLIYLFWLLIRIFILDYFHVPSESMFPTIKAGNTIIVNKFLFGPRIYTNLIFEKTGQELHSTRITGIRKIKHNDIVVFSSPVHDGKIKFIINDVYCKRVIAVPGDSLSSKNGFYINNKYHDCLGNGMQQKTLQFLSETDRYSSISHEKKIWGNYEWTIKNFGPIYIPTKGDILKITPLEANLYKYIIEWELGKDISIDYSSGSVYADGEILYTHKFSHNYYFMAGDNVVESYDSRFFGLVPEEYIIGIVNIIL